ncbi:hypothetical protein A1O1_07061 [Capronia coronata CBS 617.96]|uniref:RNB domain-containing protein n=1 Tax=Capronia coronata CBS 617.96 TaxID=1182541 RepID=W9XTA4_9EURO|nr:uncharacterized protein A1O1_07061 [Capronia coronata CBS 617.96]EXJ83438.1 hypothetical protein A1O1_07061 [Capronia coronata CBS 617.96]
MQVSRNASSSTLSRRLGYVCPECRAHLRRRIATYSQERLSHNTTSPRSTHLTREQCSATNRRARFSTRSRLASLEETSHRTDSLESTLLSSISSTLLRSDKTLPGQSAVRDHLRAWSKQNEQRKAESAEAGFDGPSRVTTLPNSLFIEEARFDDDAEDDAELEEFEDSVEGRQAVNLFPGDLIYYRPRGVKSREQLAVYMGEAGIQNQFFLADGRWLAETTQRATSPIVRGFASIEEIRPIRKHLPVKSLEKQPRDMGLATSFSFAGDVPHRDSAPLMSRLREFMEAMSDFRRDNLRALDLVHERLAHDEYYTCLPFEDVVYKLLHVRYSDLSPAARMMTFMTLRSSATSIQPVASKGREAPLFVFTPKKLVKRFEQVCEWARDYQECAAQAALGKDVTKSLERNPLSSFIEKARRLILKSRAMRSPTTTGSLGPSSIQLFEEGRIVTKDTGERFSEEDKMLLEFLWDCYIRTPVPEYRTRYHSIGSLILRAIGAYPKLRLERKIGSLLLQELGVLPPWTDPTDHDTSLQIPGRRGAHEVDQLFAESDEVSRAIGLEEKHDPSLLDDSMASLRRDLGDMPVFCVDQETTQIRDDGYSLEPDDDHPGTYWVHSHVAHPSAFITPDHIFAKRARSIGQTLYHDVVQPMFPWGFSHAVSLKAGSPALTISTLLDEDGEVKDIRIQPTRLRNVVDLDPAAVDAVLGKPAQEQAYMIVGAGDSTTIPSDGTVSEQKLQAAREHQSTLQKLQELMLARCQARRRAVPEYANWYITQNDSNAKTSYVEEYSPERLYRSYHYQGDPVIKCIAPRTFEPVRLGEVETMSNLTSLVMTLAAESAAKWFGDRGIPAFFTGSLTQPGFPLSKLNSMDMQENKRPPLGTYSSTPVPHVFLNTSAYLRVTSPIRRFTDILAHWQADAYLRAEASGLVKPGLDASKLELPYSKEMMDEYISTDAEKLRSLPYKVMRSPKIHWALRALFRAFHFKESELPTVWDLKVLTLHNVGKTGEDTGLRGQLLPFQLPTKLLESPEGWEKKARRNSFLPVKIELVDLDEMWVYCRAVGPPSDTYNFKDPIRIVPKRVGTEKASDDIPALVEEPAVSTA